MFLSDKFLDFRVYILPDEDQEQGLRLQAEAEIQTSDLLHPVRFRTAEDQPYLFDLGSSNPQLARAQVGDAVHFLLDEADSLRAHVVDPADVRVLFS